MALTWRNTGSSRAAMPIGLGMRSSRHLSATGHVPEPPARLDIALVDKCLEYPVHRGALQSAATAQIDDPHAFAARSQNRFKHVQAAPRGARTGIVEIFRIVRRTDEAETVRLRMNG